MPADEREKVAATIAALGVGGGVGRMKSILKPRSRPSAPLLTTHGGKPLLPATSEGGKKVGITTPPMSSPAAGSESQTVSDAPSTSSKRKRKRGRKTTPLPRVALMPHPRSESPPPVRERTKAKSLKKVTSSSSSAGDKNKDKDKPSPGDRDKATRDKPSSSGDKDKPSSRDKNKDKPSSGDKDKEEPSSRESSPSTTSKKTKRKVKGGKRKTPLPRVALLPHPRSMSPPPKEVKEKTKAAKEKVVKKGEKPGNRAVTPPPSTKNLKVLSQKKEKEKAGPAPPTVTGKPSKTRSIPLASTPSKKTKKKKKKSQSTSDILNTVITPDSKTPADYVQELVTINELLKSVTTAPSTVAAPGTNTVKTAGGEFNIRPFSADELRQLITSVGKVAVIQTGGKILEEKPSSKTKKKKKTRKSSKSSFSKKNRIPPRKSSSSTSNKKMKPVLATQSKNVKLEPLLPVKKSASKNLASKKTLKSNVKSIKKKVKEGEITLGDEEGDTDAKAKLKEKDDLSELDLVKSAILNRKFYEESVALEKMAAKEFVDGRRRLSQTERIRKITEIHKAHSDAKLALGGGNKVPTGEDSLNPQKLPLPLPPFNPIEGDEAYNKALGNAVVNYSHVLLKTPGPFANAPTNAPLTPHNLKPKIENRGVKAVMNEEKITFEDHLNKIKSNRGLTVDPNKTKAVKAGSRPFTPNATSGDEGDRDRVKGERKSGKKKSKRGKRRSRSRHSVTISDVSDGDRDRVRERERPKSQMRPPQTAPASDKLEAKKKKAPQNPLTPAPGGILRTRSVPPQNDDRSQGQDSTPVTDLLRHHPSRWNDQSIAPSLFQDLPQSGASRLLALNQRLGQIHRRHEDKSDKGSKPHPTKIKGKGQGQGQKGKGDERKAPHFLQNTYGLDTPYAMFKNKKEF